MLTDSIHFYIWLVVVSFAAAAASQCRGLNGRRFRPLRFFSGVFSSGMLGVAAGLGMSTVATDGIAVIVAAMAIVFLRLTPEQIWNRHARKNRKDR